MILIIDDDTVIRTSLTFLLKRANYETQAVATPEEALAIIRRIAPRLILMDMNFTRTTSGAEGLQLLKQVRIFRPDTPVILITAWGTISLAVQGMRNGAFDFVTKPWDNRQLLNSIHTALELAARKKDDQPAKALSRTAVDPKFHFHKIIGQSHALLKLLHTLTRIASTNASVLITGESGTGKELIAQAIHENSLRAREAFIKVNLGGISQSLFESEMFGHKKGAFTDAHTDRKGRFEIADRGTIFLDEIGDLDLSCQVKLLRVLQDQTYEKLGDSRPRKVDLRVISATNRDLSQMVADRTFREDLFYRINLITLHLPPLRERREDIPLLASFFAGKQAESASAASVRFTPQATAYLKSLPYPGNIRELKNLIERTLLVSGKQTLDASDFRQQYRPDGHHPVQPSAHPLSGHTLDEVEKQTILRAIEQYAGNVSHMASALGISRAALYRRLEKYGITLKT
jgi:two-component system NtrC family response regulator